MSCGFLAHSQCCDHRGVFAVALATTTVMATATALTMMAVVMSCDEGLVHTWDNEGTIAKKLLGKLNMFCSWTRRGAITSHVN